MSIEQINAIVKSCLRNAEELLQAAKAAHVAQANGSAYHLAALALEEIGKSTLVLIARSNKEEKADRYYDTAEDHEKKLFWALWAPTLNSGDVSGKQIQDFQGLAREIHQRRLSAIYVDAKTGNRLAVAPKRVEELISIAESRIGMEKFSKYGEPDENTKATFAWFERAAADKNLVQSLIFTRSSFDKLKELNGNVKEWIDWLRGVAEESEQEAKELLQRELKRARPEESEQLQPKWKIRIKLYSDSHSIRSAALTAWNKGVDFIKLHRADTNAMFVEFTVPKGIHANGLYTAGYVNAVRFVVALNMGSLGLFYWYLPTFVSRYYESVTDIENSRRLEMDLNPGVKIDWGKSNPLGTQELNNSAIVYSYMARFSGDQLRAVDHYLRGLAFLCKSDVFFQLTHGAIQAFFVTLRELMRLNLDWDGMEPFKTAIQRTLKEFIESMPDMLRVLDLAESVEKRTEGATVTMQETFMMKALCDLYVIGKAQKALNKHIQDKQSSSASIKPSIRGRVDDE
ncbi:MAG: AbiV family abortive infection protein [Terriglobales bacterium]